MTVLTFVTCCAPHRADHLPETAASVRETRAALEPLGVTVRWRVGGDGGPLPKVAHAAAAAAGARIDHTAMRLRVAAARGRLIAEVAAAAGPEDWIAPLDDDDVLVADGWARLWGMWAPETGWVGMQRTFDLGAERDGPHHVIDADRDFAAGAFPYQRPSLFHPASVLVRAPLATHVGYPHHLPYNEDLAWVHALAAHAPGALRTVVTLRYRTWDAQLTAEAEYHDEDARQARAAACIAYANAHRVAVGLPPLPPIAS